MKILLLSFLLFGTTLRAQPDYAAYDALLRKYVDKNGAVNYKGLKQNTKALANITAAFSAQKPTDSWSRNESLAFWINAYNAFTLQLIVDNYPLQSITELDGGKTWDVKRIDIGGTKYSLNQIENEIIRPRFKDPRIHFAVNCAAKSCPPLLNRAYQPATLDKQLEEQTRQFIRSANNEIRASGVRLSKIFEWYREDFGNLPAFLSKYAGLKVAPGAKIEFLSYDWGLNE